MTETIAHDRDFHLAYQAITRDPRCAHFISTLREGLTVSMKHPALLGVFREAVSDNVRDRVRGGERSAPRFIAASGKEGVPSVV